MLARELLNKRDRTIMVSVGALIGRDETERFRTDLDLTKYLRLMTYALKDRGRRRGWKGYEGGMPDLLHEPVIAKVDAKTVERDVANLSPGNKLIEGEQFDVMIAGADQIPYLLNEIGRLREISFRACGEGTGKAIDLDRFDGHYLHLFVWNKQDSEVVGAYRLGKTDEIIAKHGTGGLYTNTLFKFDKGFFSRIGPSLELGRSFIRPEYQRNHMALPLLWKGIEHFVAKNPVYKNLLGPVSISNEYSPASREIIHSCLSANHLAHGLTGSVRPRNPFRPGRTPSELKDAGLLIKDVDDLSSAVSGIERDGKSIPVLLRHYLKLGGRLIKFNVDRDFSDVLDGLILVNLLDAGSRTLHRYLGQAGAEGFLDLHGGKDISPSSEDCA